MNEIVAIINRLVLILLLTIIFALKIKLRQCNEKNDMEQKMKDFEGEKSKGGINDKPKNNRPDEPPKGQSGLRKVKIYCADCGGTGNAGKTFGLICKACDGFGFFYIMV